MPNQTRDRILAKPFVNASRSRWKLCKVVFLLAALALSACSPIATLRLAETPTAIPFATPTITPTVTDTPMPSPTAGATETAALTATATRRPAAPAVRATSTPAPPRSVFVTAIKIDPLSVRSNQSPHFTATFLNTTGQTQSYRWFVKIYTPDQSQSFGETSKVDNDIPPSTTQLKSASDWKTQTFFDCLSFIARVFWVDADNQVHEFLKPNGTNPATGLTVCP